MEKENWEKESQEWQQASADDIVNDLEKKEINDWTDEFDEQFSAHSGELENDYVDCVQSKEIKDFIRKVRQEAIEEVIKELKAELEAGADCYMDMEGANADELNGLAYAIKFIESKFNQPSRN
jgi:hypothetical protein